MALHLGQPVPWGSRQPPLLLPGRRAFPQSLWALSSAPLSLLRHSVHTPPWHHGFAVPAPPLPATLCSLGLLLHLCLALHGGGCWSRKPHPLRSPPWEWLLGTSFHDQDDSGRWRPCDWPHLSLWALKQGSCDSVSLLALGPLGGALGGVLVHAGPCSLLSARAARSAADLLHTLWAILVSRLRHFGRLVATRQPCHARGR